MRRFQVFLSYAREDYARVESLYYQLLNSGFKPWMDKKNILPGERWEDSIWRAIRHSDFFLACLSSKSTNKRGFLQREIKRALTYWDEKLDSDIYLIPIRLEECDVPENLRELEWLDLFEPTGWPLLLQALNEGVKRQAESSEVQTASFGQLRLKFESLHESSIAHPTYDIEIEYPQIEGTEISGLEEINFVIKGYVAGEMQEFRKLYTSEFAKSIDSSPEYPHHSSLDITHNVTLLDDNLFSMAFNILRYDAGAAHPNHWTRVYNFKLKPLVPIDIHDLFQVDSSYLEFISNYCMEDLKKQVMSDEYGDDGSGIWEGGVSPNEENFKNFNLSQDSLVLTFDPYQVGPFAWGTMHVVISYSEIKHLIDLNGPLAPLAM